MFLSVLLYAIFSGLDEASHASCNDSSQTFLDDLALSSDESLINWGFVLDDDYNDN